MPDLRELFEDPEEAFRAAVNGLRDHTHTMMPGIVSEDSADGHTGTVQIAVKRKVYDKVHDQISYVDFPVLVDVPIHHPGAGGVTTTYAVKKGDEVLVPFASSHMDFWHQNGGTQQPGVDRVHSLGDAMMIPGLRSDPRKLQQVSSGSSQARSDDKHHVVELHPINGHHEKTVDPSTPPASADFDPFTQATKFFERIAHPTNGHAHNATDGDTTHSVTNTHEDGPKLSAANGSSTIGAHPTQGSVIASTIAHLISAPNASLDHGGNLSTKGSVAAPTGSFSQGVSFGAGGAGGTMTSTGTGGDLAGEISSPTVVGATDLPVFDTAALALTTLGAGKFYINRALGAQAATSTTTGASGATTTSTTPAVASFYSQGILVVCVTG